MVELEKERSGSSLRVLVTVHRGVQTSLGNGKEGKADSSMTPPWGPFSPSPGSQQSHGRIFWGRGDY